MSAIHEDIKAVATGLLYSLIDIRNTVVVEGDIQDEAAIPQLWFFLTEKQGEREAQFIDPPPGHDSWESMDKDLMYSAMVLWLTANRPDYIGHVAEAWAVKGSDKSEAAQAVSWMSRGMSLKDFPGAREIITVTIQSPTYNLQLMATLPGNELEEVVYEAFDSDHHPDFEIAGRMGEVAAVLRQPFPGSIDVD